MAVRETFSKFVATGRVKENKKLEIVDNKFEDGTPYQTIRGRFVLAVDNGEYTCEVYCNSKFRGEDHKSNSDFDSFAELSKCAMDTPVEVQIRTNKFNDYTNKRGTISSVDCLNANRIKFLSEPAQEEKFEGAIEGMLTKVVPEIRNDEETGRLKVEITGVGYGEKALPHSLFVPSDLADDFNSIYELGSLATFDVEIKTVVYGEQKTERTGGFGRKAEINTGFTRPEWIVIGGDEPIDEDRVGKNGEPLYIDPNEINNMLEARSVELEQILKEAKDGKKAPKGGKPSFKNMSKGASMADGNPFDAGSNPFL